MNVVFCVMNKSELFAIYESSKEAEIIAKRMTEKCEENYHVETRAIL